MVGFDDIALAPYVIPSLASVKMPVTEMIQETISRLITMVEEGEPEALPSFSGKLVRRDSLKRLVEGGCLCAGQAGRDPLAWAPFAGLARRINICQSRSTREYKSSDG